MSDGFTAGGLAALRRAYQSGVLLVEYEGRRTQYASEADLIRRIREVERALGVGLTTPAPRAGVATFSRGD